MCLPGGAEGSYILFFVGFFCPPRTDAHECYRTTAAGYSSPRRSYRAQSVSRRVPPFRSHIYLVLVLRCCLATSSLCCVGSLVAPRGLSGGGTAAAVGARFAPPRASVGCVLCLFCFLLLSFVLDLRAYGAEIIGCMVAGILSTE